jgi:hypothetical protein
MVALAGIGDFAPDTVRDRAVVVTMRRRSTAEPVDTFRSRRDAPQFRELGERLHDWATSRLDALGDARPDMPVEDRAADTWEPLVAVADAAGGSWPARARASCLSLTDEAVSGEAELSSSVRLLLDIRDAFEEAETISMSSENLVTHLRALPDAPWNEWALTPNGLAKRLHRYGVAPDRIPVVNGRQQRGYRSQDFTDAWARYLPPVAPDVEDVTPSSSEVRD